MPKFVIRPIDVHGAPVIRGMTSVKDDATPEQIEAQVQQAVKRGGKKVAFVLLCGVDRQVTQAWAVNEGVVAPIDVTPYLLTEEQLLSNINAAASSPATEAQPDANVAETEESEMAAKKTKSKKKSVKKVAKTPKTKKAPGAGGLRTGSQQETIYNLLTRKSGVTSDEAVKATGWKSCSPMTWGKKFGLKVTKEKSAAGVTRYYGA